MPELLDELVVARADNLLKKVSRAYAQVDLLILDEWLLCALTVQQAFDLLEIIEARTKHGATVFCTQYDTDGWYERINSDPNQDSPIADAIMDRIVHSASAMACTRWRTAVMASEQSLQACTQGNVEVPKAIS